MEKLHLAFAQRLREAMIRAGVVTESQLDTTLAEWLGVEPQTLRFGDEVAQAVRKRRKAWDEGIGYQEREIFELFLKLPVPQRNVAREVIVALARANTLLPLAGAR